MKKIDITPVGKPRQTQSDRWKQRPTVMRYRAFADELRLKYRKPLPLDVTLVFGMPMPKSWSVKKQLEKLGQPHDQKPDIDNLIKSVLDALAPDDKDVWRVHASKFWAKEGMLWIGEINEATGKERKVTP